MLNRLKTGDKLLCYTVHRVDAALLVRWSEKALLWGEDLHTVSLAQYGLGPGSLPLGRR